jgi:hypothetical protein
LGAVGNYAIKTEGATTHIAFEHDADADRLAAVLRPKQTTRETELGIKVVGDYQQCHSSTNFGHSQQSVR